MAVLSAQELQSIRGGCAENVVVNYTKAQLNAAAQAVEDLLTASETTISNTINTATSPLVLTVAQKKRLFAHVVLHKYMRDR